MNQIGQNLTLHKRARQDGVVLVVSLMLLVVMMILAGTSLDMAVLDERMVTNWQVSSQTFQYAESAATSAENDDELLSRAINTALPGPQDAYYMDNGTQVTEIEVDNVTYSGTGEFMGETILSGYSMGEDASSLSAFRFEVTGSAEHSDGANTTTVHGFYRIAPSLSGN